MKFTTFILIFFISKIIAQNVAKCPNNFFLNKHVGYQPKGDLKAKAVEQVTKAVGVNATAMERNQYWYRYRKRSMSRPNYRSTYRYTLRGQGVGRRSMPRYRLTYRDEVHVEYRYRYSENTVYVFPYNKDTFDQVLTYEQDGNLCRMTSKPKQTPGEPTKFICRLKHQTADPSKNGSWTCESRGKTNRFPVHSVRNGNLEM